MNFLLRPAQPSVPDQLSVQEPSTPTHSLLKPVATLEGLIAEDPYSPTPSNVNGDAESDGISGVSGGLSSQSTKHQFPIVENHSDVTEDEGWIIIPYKELPDNWTNAPDIHSLRSLNRSFVFPGEQVHILACLSTAKQDTELITPFRVAAVMSKNGITHSTKRQKESMGIESNSVAGEGEEESPNRNVEQNGANLLTTERTDPRGDISASESLLRIEDHKKRTETLLTKFKNSHFFVRIAESDEPLWSKRSVPESSETVGGKLTTTDAGARKASKKDTHVNAVIDRGNFDASVSGGLARDTVRCCSLSSGDIVVLLGVQVGVDLLKHPTLEVLQFEKHQDKNVASDKGDNLINTNQEDPCGELLKWLLPLDHSLPPPARPLSPPLSNTSGFGSTSHKSTVSASSGSQIFSFSHFRSYSMSSLPPSNATLPSSVTASVPKPTFDQEDWDRFSPQNFKKSQEAGTEGLLSFRGVPLEPERFSVHCGLEGIYMPGRRWRRKLEIIQPLEIHSFAADCNTEDLLCVQIKNVSPAHTPDIVIFLDAISIVFEEVPKGGTLMSLPIACIEAGIDHSLPNLALRRGEEHSFILKPKLMWKNHKVHGEKIPQSSHIQAGSSAPNLHLPPKVVEGRRIYSSADQYAVLVSCRCNYTESKLFFKQPTSWRPRLTRDLIISVASEMSEKRCGLNGGVDQLLVQVLTLQASNLTSEDLTLTVLAPASYTSPPTVVSLNSSPSIPTSPFVVFSEVGGRVGGESRSSGVQRLASIPVVSENNKESAGTGTRSVSFNEQSISDVIPSTVLGCTHLWLQSRVPLGRVPSQSTATVKLELLPLTDGIIALDTLQIDVKEKGLTYIPEQSLKINATSSIATGIL
ncbi:uncharacterized protein LOC122642424 isoform X2 [Telopea speciosissima]|uniref:uncharacterized protein LOC122642424 isoform X2 n=1 Tax=Telopea speciosissima TaxID=54955 RepID=UPI001CC7C1B6|nr:uncharacterized protein LOC122642424 isoform X2 [Telopea speciosissima]